VRLVSAAKSPKAKAASKPAKKAAAAAEEKPPESIAERIRMNGIGPDERMPIKMLNDRILVNLGLAEGERKTTGGILIPATAQVGKRLAWGEVIAAGPNVRAMEAGDQVLFNPVQPRGPLRGRGARHRLPHLARA